MSADSEQNSELKSTGAFRRSSEMAEEDTSNE